jgi:hypothetical protein
MANIINRQQTFSTNGTVTAAGLHNLIDTALVNSAIIKNQQEITSIGTADLLLIAPDSVDASLAPRKVTVQNLLDDGLTAGTFVSLNLTGALTYGTATGNRTVSTSATITNGTITNGVIPTGTFGTTTSTAATITNGTITTALIPTLTAGTTTGTAGIFTSGTVATLNSTTGTIGTLNSTTGTITNLSTTLAGDFTISQGTATLATSGATAGTYGSVTAIPFITVDAKGRITSATTGTFSSTPADGSITPAKLSQPFTLGTSVASTSGTAIDFTSIPSWVKRITISVFNISYNGSDHGLIQLGVGSTPTTSGYNSVSNFLYGGNSSGQTSSTSGFIWYDLTNSYAMFGTYVFTKHSGNTWIGSSLISNNTGINFSTISNGYITLSSDIGMIRILGSLGGSFDGGSVNIIYE